MTQTHERAAEVSVGEAVGTSDWVVIDQAMIDGFATHTLDPDPLHIDPEWAAQGPYGGTIAFGFLTLSLLTYMLHSATGRPAQKEVDGHYLNYGFDRVRLISPVRVGSRVRGHFTKLSQTLDAKGRLLAKFEATIEIEGEERPALVAEWLSIWVPV